MRQTIDIPKQTFETNAKSAEMYQMGELGVRKIKQEVAIEPVMAAVSNSVLRVCGWSADELSVTMVNA